MLQMKLLLQISSRIRFYLAMAAMLSAMWAAVDLHQHENGFYQSAHCVVCSLEKAVAHGFTLQAIAQLLSPQHVFFPIQWLEKQTFSLCVRLLPIRAPPLS